MAEAPILHEYRIVRYVPNVLRDEWVNIGVFLQNPASGRREFRVIEEARAIARVRQMHPAADQDLLRALPLEFEGILHGPAEEVARRIAKLEQTLSNTIQFGPQKAVLAVDFGSEIDRLYHEQVAPPQRTRQGLLESTREWIKSRINDVFLRRRVPGIERNIPAEQFTEPGDPLKLDYGYRNGVRGFLQALTLGRDPGQAKILAYTAERVRLKISGCEFTAITETEPVADKSRHQFIVRLLEQQEIQIVPLNRIERFAEELRLRLH